MDLLEINSRLEKLERLAFKVEPLIDEWIGNGNHKGYRDVFLEMVNERRLAKIFIQMIGYVIALGAGLVAWLGIWKDHSK
jgi:hypothetical protein